MKHFVVSDLHLGDGSGKDNFKKNEGKFRDFLKKVKKDKGQLVIAGDLFELWQCSIFDIFHRYHRLLAEMLELNPIIVVGNHDIELVRLAGLSLPFTDRIIAEGYFIPGSKIYVEHGNAYDAWNDPKRALKAGRFIAHAIGYAEYVDPKAEETMSELWGGMRRLFQSPEPQMKESWDWNTPANRPDPDIDKYIRGAKKRIKQSKGTRKRIWRIVMGHTHQEGFTKDWTVFNSGSWVTDRPSYAEVNPGMNHVEIKYWPSGKKLEWAEHWKKKG